MNLRQVTLGEIEAVMVGTVCGWDSSKFYLRDVGGLKTECGPWLADRGSHLCYGEKKGCVVIVFVAAYSYVYLSSDMVRGWPCCTIFFSPCDYRLCLGLCPAANRPGLVFILYGGGRCV